MKRKITVFNKTTWLVIPIIFVTTFLIIHGQSGKVIQTSESAPVQTPTPEVIESKKSETKSDFLVDMDADKYNLVFATSYEGNLRFSPKEEAERKRRRHFYVNSTNSFGDHFNNFVDQLNEAGEHGYKLISASDSDMALLELDETQYEYDWFQTNSSFFFAKSAIQEKLEAASSKGFRVIDSSLLSGYCELEKFDYSDLALEKCQYLDFFLLGKKKGSKKSTEQILINSFPGWGANPSLELEKQIDEKLADGFYPVDVFSKFEILLEKTKEKDERDKPEVRIIAPSWGSLEKKVNELAKQGYRLALTNNGIAVMYRKGETAQIPLSYVWVRADKKSFAKELAKLEEKGGVYKTTYPSGNGTKNSLIFEQKLKDDGNRTEFKILKFEFDVKENQAEKKVYVDLTPSSKEAVKTMNALAKEGFVARALFFADGVSVILERRK